jgi:hypothetical protein
MSAFTFGREFMSFKSPNLTNLQSMSARIAAIYRNWGQRNAIINGKTRLRYNATEEQERQADNARRAELAGSREVALNEIGEARKAIELFHSGLVKDLGAALDRPQAKDVNESLLRELREQRFWQRTKPLLDGAKDLLPVVEKMAREALASGDEDAYAALKTEMPAYLTTRDAGHLTPLIEGALDQELVRVKPELQPAIEAKAQIEKGRAWLDTAANYVEHAVSNGRNEVSVIGWSGEVESINLESPAVAGA